VPGRNLFSDVTLKDESNRVVEVFIGQFTDLPTLMIGLYARFTERERFCFTCIDEGGANVAKALIFLRFVLFLY